MIGSDMPSYATAMQAFIVIGTILVIVSLFVTVNVSIVRHLGRLVSVVLVLVGILAALGLAAGIVGLWHHADWIEYRREQLGLVRCALLSEHPQLCDPTPPLEAG